MNTDLNQEEYPRLVPPKVVYENKASLKKPVVIPLYAKIIASAAAVALLFGIFWNHYVTPELEMIAELKPVGASRIEMEETTVLAESQACFIIPRRTVKRSVAQGAEQVSFVIDDRPIIAELQPKTTVLIDFGHQPEALYDGDVRYVYIDTPLVDSEEYDSDLSLVGKCIYWMTDGEHDSFASLFGEGVRNVKTDMATVATTLQSSRDQLRQMVR